MCVTHLCSSSVLKVQLWRKTISRRRVAVWRKSSHKLILKQVKCFSFNQVYTHMPLRILKLTSNFKININRSASRTQFAQTLRSRLCYRESLSVMLLTVQYANQHIILSITSTVIASSQKPAQLPVSSYQQRLSLNMRKAFKRFSDSDSWWPNNDKLNNNNNYNNNKQLFAKVCESWCLLVCAWIHIGMRFKAISLMLFEERLASSSRWP